MARGPWLMTGLWSAGTAAATALSWIGAHAASSAIGATPVPVVPPAPPALAARARTGLAGRTSVASTAAIPATASAPRPATFSDPGGTVTVRCTTPARIELVSASPSDGYRGDVGSDGPTRVSITFISRDRAYEIDVKCSDGRPVERSTFNQSPSPPPPR